ncbi:MAG: beta-propeller fold lactonase family protein [Planctomycetota bacterium]|nr:beta-propeller fold lactonase family protein [Planctomycetota bacterium]
MTTNTVRAVALSASTHAPLSAGPAASTGLAPTDATVSRDGRFLYVNCQLGNRIDVFSIDPLSGLPGRNQIQPAGTQPVALVLAPSGKFLYASGSADSLLRAYSVERDTGRLAEIAVTPTGSRPSLLTFDPTGKRLYSVASDAYEVEIFEADASLGVLARSESVRTRELPLGLAILPADETAQQKSHFAYVSTSDSDEVAVFSVDPQSGSLANIVDPLPSAGQRQELAVHPSLAWVFATRASDGMLDVLAVNPHSGALTPQGAPFATAADPIAVLCDPSGARVHVLCGASATLQSFGFDAVAGTLVPLASAALPPAPSALAIDPTGRFLYVARRSFDRIETLAIDPLTADLVLTAGIDLAGEPTDLAVLPDGRYLLAASAATGLVTLCELSELDGSLTPIVTRPVGANPVSIASDPIGRFLYVGSRDTAGVGDISVLRFAPNALLTGFVTSVGSVTAGQNPIAVRVDGSGSHLYVAAETSRDVTRLSIDRSTGLLGNPESTSMGATPRGLALSSTRR